MVDEPAFQPAGRGGERLGHRMGAAIETHPLHRQLSAIDQVAPTSPMSSSTESSESFTSSTSAAGGTTRSSAPYLEASYTDPG